MTLAERNERLEAVKIMKEHISFVSNQLKEEAHSFEILVEMREYLEKGLTNNEDFDYESLANFIKTEYNRIKENYVKR